MKAPLLSICIATHNRAQYIGETLEGIIPQITDEVEIVIVDGASTDNTKKVVHDYIQKCDRIRYVLLPEKGGIDYDYNQAVEFARGDYCWLFTDDDLLKPDAVRIVRREILKGYSLLVINAQVLSRDLLQVLENKRLAIDTDEICDGSKLGELFERTMPLISFIGCIVIKRDLWIQREKKRYYGTEFIHVGIIFQALLPAPALIIAEPYITIRYGNAQWLSRAVEIWIFKWPNLIASFSHIPEKIKQKHQMINPWRRLRRTILFRGIGAYSLKEYHKWFMSKDFSLFWRLVALLIAILPVCFVNLSLLGYLKATGGDPIISYDLENADNNLMNMLHKKRPC